MMDNLKYTSKAFNEHKRYWSSKTKEFAEAFNFKLIQSGDLTQERKTVSVEINDQLAKRCVQLSNNSDPGIFLCFSTALSIMFKRLSGNEKIIIHTPKLLNEISEEEATVPLLFEVNEAYSLKQYLEINQKMLTDSYGFQDYPLALLNEGEELFGSTVCIAYDKIHTLPDISQQYDIYIGFKQEQGKFIVSVNYRKYFFDQLVLENVPVYFEKVLEAFANLDLPIWQVSILTEEDSIKIDGFNKTVDIWTRELNLVELFQKSVLNYPDNTALVYKHTRLTYAELDAKSSQLASLIASNYQLEKDDIVAVMLDKSERSIISFLAVLKAGAAYLPVDPGDPVERRTFIISDAAPKLLITDSNYLFEIENFSGNIFAYDIQIAGIDSHRIQPQKNIDPSDLAYVIYTSGSTGKPKGSMIEHRSVTNMVLSQIKEYKVQPGDCCLQFASFSFDASVYEIYMALLAGATLAITDKDITHNSELFESYLCANKVSIVTFPTSFLASLNVEKLSALRLITTAGEAANVALAAQLSKRYTYYNAYGPTECAVCVSQYRVTPDDRNRNSIPIGKPIKNTRIQILGECLQQQPIGVWGELYVGGVGLSREYLNQPGLTAEKFVNWGKDQQRYYKTGDIGRWTQEGNIEFQGRKDSQVKIRGFRVELGEIETVIGQHPFISNNVVLIKRNETGSHSLVCYLISDQQTPELQLEKFLENKLPAYMIPERYVQLSEFPVTHSGKVDRNKLVQLHDLNKNELAYIAPHTVNEKLIEKEWSEVLKNEKIGAEDNFFNLGGDSIKAIVLVSKINLALGTAIEVNHIFNHPTIRGLAAFIEALPKDSNSVSKKKLEEAFSKKIKDTKNELLKGKSTALLPDSIEDIFPMSDIQKGMVFHYMADQQNGVYHDQIMKQFEDNSFQLNTFKKAISLMIEKHAMLRTSFYLTGFEEPMQVIHRSDTAFPEFTFEDISALTVAEQVKHLEIAKKEDRKKAIDVKQPCLWRIKIFKLAATEYGLLFITHHAIIDGWSEASLFTELNNVYLALKENEKYVLAPLRSGYKDYVIDQLVTAQRTDVKEFWKQYLAEYTPMELPLCKSKEKHSVLSEPLFYSFAIGEREKQALQVLALDKNISIKNILFSAFCYLMRLCTGSSDVLVGLVTHGRPEREDADKVIGCFLNTVPFRVNLSTSVSPERLIERIAAELLLLKANEKLSLLEIQKLIQPQSFEGNIFFDVLFNYIDFHVYQSRDTALQIKTGISETFGNTNTLFDFVVYGGDSISISISGPSQLYSKMDFERIGIYYNNIIKLMIDAPAETLSNNKLIDQEEKNNLLRIFNATKTPLPAQAAVIDIFECNVLNTPDAIALEYGEIVYTYSALNEIANQLANYLQVNYSITPGSLIATQIAKDEKLIIALLAILKMSSAYLTIDTSYPKERIDLMIKDSNCNLVITDQVIETFFKNRKNFPVTNIKRPQPSDIAYIMYTSGTTGKPKAVVIRDKAIVRLVCNCNYVDLTKPQRLLSTGSISFDAFTFEVWAMLLNNSTLVLPTENWMNPPVFQQIIRQKQIDIMWLTASLFNYYIDNSPTVFTGIKNLLIGGEKLSGPHVKKLMNLYPAINVINGYGPTENTTFSICHAIKPNESENIPLGKPISNSTCYILNEELELLPIGVKGEIFVGGDGLGLVYLNAPQLTSEKFISNPYLNNERMYRTGDSGSWDSEGLVYYHGRKDNQIKIRGYRIELNEIEHALMSFESKAKETLKSVAVKFLKDEKGEPYLSAYYTANGQQASEEIKQYLEAKLPAYMIPNFFIFLSEMPLTVNGKINLAKLPNPDFSDVTKNRIIVPPRNEKERIILEHFAAALHLPENAVGVKSDFFELGGNSIKVLNLSSRLFHHFEAEIATIFECKTVEKIAKKVAFRTESVEKNSMIMTSFSQFYRIQEQVNPALKNVFFIPPGNGLCMCYHDLIKMKNDEINGFLFTFSQLDNSDLIKNIHDLINSYLELILLNVQSKDVYLVGYSSGGNIVFEIAKKLEKLSYNVKLFLIDSLPKEEKNSHSFDEILAGMEKYAKLNDIDNEILTSYKNTCIKFSYLWNQYQIEENTLSSDVCIFISKYTELNEVEKWNKYIAGNIELIVLPEGLHQEVLDSDRNLEIISNKLELYSYIE